MLCSLIALSLLGQTINVMTLGGLALAVGILVDDATVTIENINRHMEEFGEDIVTAITRGAQEIMPPATIALFCICIAFVRCSPSAASPAILFRPLAMAVVFAMVASYALTYTVVPTLARFLLKDHDHHAPAEPGRKRSVFGRIQQGFERGFERLRLRYLGMLHLGAHLSKSLRQRLPRRNPLVVRSGPFLGRDFFPSIDSDALRIHVRAPTGLRIEETTALNRSRRGQDPGIAAA